MTDVPIFFVEHLLWDDAVTYDAEHVAFRKDVAGGAAEWADNQDGSIGALIYSCPCGCGQIGAISVSTGAKQEKGWLWNGDKERPTLTPSILRTTGCRWHGFLTDGVWRQC